MSVYTISRATQQLDDLKKGIRWYVNVHWLIITALVISGIGASLILRGWGPIAQRSIGVALAGYAITALAAWAAALDRPRRRLYATLAFLMILFDLVATTYLGVYESAIQNEAFILYTLPIIMAGMLFGARMTYITAGAASVAFAFTQSITFSERAFEGGVFARFNEFIIRVSFTTAVFFILGVVAEYVAVRYRSREVEHAEDDMMALITHQMRVPIVAIRGLLELVEKEVDLKDAQRHYLQMAVVESNRELSMVDNLLKAAMEGRGILDVKAKKVALQPMVESVIKEHAYAAKQQDVSVTAAIPEVTVWADEKALRIMLSNLVDNAIKYSPKDTDVWISYEEDDGSDVIHVSDQGVGIAPHELNTVFKRFQRAEKTSDTVSGAGLGLHIVKVLATKHNGTVEVRSKKGSGTTFTLRLPKGEE